MCDEKSLRYFFFINIIEFQIFFDKDDELSLISFFDRKFDFQNNNNLNIHKIHLR